MSLIVNGIIIYKYFQNKKKTNLDGNIKTPENIEIGRDGDKRSSLLELEEINLDDEPKETDNHPDTSDSAKILEEGGVGIVKEPIVSENEGKCSSQCESVKPRNDQGKYTELPQNEPANGDKPAATHSEGYCSLM